MRTNKRMPRFLPFILTAGMALATLGPSSLPAQDQQPSREERLRQHEERVREIIQQRRRETMERNKEQQAPQPAPEEPTPPADEEGLPQLGRVILTNVFRVISDEEGEIRQADLAVRKGQRFLSEVILKNEGGTTFDELEIALDYDKRFIRPIRVFDAGIEQYLAEKPEFRRIERDSILVYRAKLDQPRGIIELPVLKIVWEALRPIEHTGLNFVFASGDTDSAPHTAVYQNGQNILGDPVDPIDGVLGSSILIQKPITESDRPEVLQGKKEELRDLYLGAVGSDTKAGIALSGPSEPVAVGEEFTLDVMLNNPFGAVIDNVSFFLKFDPEVLEVVDTDRGNWIKRGINVHDAPFRLEYPFDYHKKNEVDNIRGYVTYAMGLGSTIALPSGTFAQVHFRARKPVAEAEVELIAGRQGARDLTSLETFGYNIMSGHPKLTTPLYSVTVVPEPLEGEMLAKSAEDSGPPPPPPFLFLPSLLPNKDDLEGTLSHR